MLRQSIQLLERFCQEDRIRIEDPRSQLQVRVSRRLSPTAEFLSYIDAIGDLDQRPAVIEWKTTSARYAEEPLRLLTLDPQLPCYSWMTAIAEVTMIVFVRKRFPEIQYLRTTISDEQREQYRQLVTDTISQIESGRFLARSGIHFPNNGCTSCPFIGLCLSAPDLISSKLVKSRGASMIRLSSLVFRPTPVLPKLNRKRGLLVIAKIDEILSWEARAEHGRDSKFVELGKYLYEVRAGQYWRLESLSSFDDFLRRRFPESRRKAY